MAKPKKICEDCDFLRCEVDQMVDALIQVHASRIDAGLKRSSDEYQHGLMRLLAVMDRLAHHQSACDMAELWIENSQQRRIAAREARRTAKAKREDMREARRVTRKRLLVPRQPKAKSVDTSPYDLPSDPLL